MSLVNPLTPLIEQFAKLPGIGPKSAQRIAFYVLSRPAHEIQQFGAILADIKKRVQYCRKCFNISSTPQCATCEDPTRDVTSLCVVSEPKDVFALERTREFKGLYHVLGGLISPIDGIHAEGLRIRELQTRIRELGTKELILAINPTIEGDATTLYLKQVLNLSEVKVSKLAYGLPVGGDIDYADELTLQRSFIGRTSI
ncbi:MAG: recombination protein RecR [Candidatus Marinamargulisbacteria bacterium]|jgi:recombination protein RecR